MNTRFIAAIGLVLALGGCGVDSTSVQWGGLCAPPDSAAQCTFAEKCDAQYIGDVTLDPGQSNDLWLIVQMNNMRLNNAVPETGQVNTADAYVQEYDIEFEGSSRTATSPVSSSVVPAEGTAVLSLHIPFPGGSVAVGTVVTALVRAKGIFADQTKFETAQLRVPVTITVLGVPSCAPGEVLSVCPPALGQLPVSVSCD